MIGAKKTLKTLTYFVLCYLHFVKKINTFITKFENLGRDS